MVYATNHSRGVEVFKAAELKAARLQDQVRHEAQIRKTRQPALLFDEDPPSSRLSMELRDRYSKQAWATILQLLSSQAPLTGVPYRDLFCEAMAFPLVSPSDLAEWIIELEPKVRIEWEPGTKSRRKPQPMKEDRIIVIDPQALTLMKARETN